MSYEAWRITFQSSEGAARAAYNEITALHQQLAEAEAKVAEGIAKEIWLAAMEKCQKERTNPADRNDLFFGCRVARGEKLK